MENFMDWMTEEDQMDFFGRFSESEKVFMMDNGMFLTIEEIPHGLAKWAQSCNVGDVINFEIQIVRIQ